MCLPCDRFMNSNYHFVFDSMMKFQPNQKVTEITPWTFGFYSNKKKWTWYLRKKKIIMDIGEKNCDIDQIEY